MIDEKRLSTGRKEKRTKQCSQCSIKGINFNVDEE
jgi:hypothetical protein